MHNKYKHYTNFQCSILTTMEQPSSPWKHLILGWCTFLEALYTLSYA